MVRQNDVANILFQINYFCVKKVSSNESINIKVVFSATEMALMSQIALQSHSIENDVACGKVVLYYLLS
jgi:hypothetical protein